jgi:hypothetical protein
MGEVKANFAEYAKTSSTDGLEEESSDIACKQERHNKHSGAQIPLAERRAENQLIIWHQTSYAQKNLKLCL